ncbi:hypothetical protein ALI22I_20490 [Saccharothrix sp. ALI-22-I]|uniref:GNAT family N-acetyltransferase n=1 Tax=Saccharothrix sp. ALI-22-I TaxID=1933778 RepID=UPI00097CA2A7|nr:GNAT family N-acetyltransferase [Saccharothrix sp. ALI-22-I]ONI88119.1 hypothetical protein ALI22I_20490 [Saccharothrix sp. ALI-22-I]
MTPEKQDGTAIPATSIAGHTVATIPLPGPGAPDGQHRVDTGLRWDREPGTAPPPDHDLDENRLALVVRGHQVGYVDLIDCERFVWIEDIVVVPGRRGVGIGSRLLDAVCDHYGNRVLGLALPRVSDPEHDDGTRRLRGWYGRRGFRDGRLLDVDCLVRPQWSDAR